MARDKARIYKHAGYWYCDRPSVGFGSRRINRAATFRGLLAAVQGEMSGGNAGPQVERAPMPDGGTSYGWPAVIA